MFTEVLLRMPLRIHEFMAHDVDQTNKGRLGMNTSQRILSQLLTHTQKLHWLNAVLWLVSHSNTERKPLENQK